jgi:uncharacterized membrane protein
VNDKSQGANPSFTLTKGRLEAFSDGVLAIILTIMVLELKTPHGAGLEDLLPLLPIFFSYVLSFIYVGIYWNNHHHLMHAVEKISGGVMWANLHLLFWLSLVPFVTHMLGEHPDENLPSVLYGFVLLMAGLAFSILVRTLIGANGESSTLAQVIGKDNKGKVSLVIYSLGIGLSFWNSLAGIGCYIVVALIWLVPDRRIERHAE